MTKTTSQDDAETERRLDDAEKWQVARESAVAQKHAEAFPLLRQLRALSEDLASAGYSDGARTVYECYSYHEPIDRAAIFKPRPS